MAKLIIRNVAHPQWTAVIEERVRFVLGSILTNVRRLEIYFDRCRGRSINQCAYTCQLVVIDRAGRRRVLHNQQMDPGDAIDGVLARTRRALTRQQRGYHPGWQTASAR